MVKILNIRKIEKRVITKNRQMRKIISYINQAKLKTYKKTIKQNYKIYIWWSSFEPIFDLFLSNMKGN